MRSVPLAQEALHLAGEALVEALVASACPLGSLGQVHRLDEALARALRAMASVTVESGAVLTLRWAWPTAIYGEGGRYWRQALGEGLDLNAPT